MALDSRRRARQLAKKAAKDKARRAQKRREGFLQHLPGIAQLSVAPIHEAMMLKRLFDLGIGSVLLSRKIGNTIWAGVFLVDTFCLGVKSAFLTARSEAEYARMVESMREREDIIQIHPTCARKLVEGAVAYAKDLGFGPDKDYHAAKAVFGNIDANACPTSFEFGQDGKPCFISGPHDSEAKCRQIVNQLAKRCGPGGFHYTVAPGGGSEDFLDFYEEDTDEEEPEEE